MKKNIVKVWNDRGIIKDNIKFLSRPTKQVQFPLNKMSNQIIKDLIDTFKGMQCAGIAANQIHYDQQIFIGCTNVEEGYETSLEEAEASLSNNENNPYANSYEIYINPKIVRKIRVMKPDQEGCLSMPGLMLYCARHNEIGIEYQDTDGNKIKKTIDGFQSKLFQHELAHLNGELMIDNALEVLHINELYAAYLKPFNEYWDKIK